jgi:hypothetical protein
MGRAALGASAKSKIGSVRLTPTEEAAIIAKYGSVTRFLRIMVDRELAKGLAA